jgi:hypothetical protein
LTLLQQCGAIESAYDFHWQRFLFDNFPKGTGFPKLEAPVIAEDLPLATVQAYSIDDSQTTEIDDALSLQGLGSGSVTLGIHIAAPGLAMQPGSALDELGRSRLSTVYMPGYKVTMLPDDVVQRFTLAQGQACPAVSLYVCFNEASLEIEHSHTLLERVPIAANLRHDQLDEWVTPEWLELQAPLARPGAPVLPIEHASLAFLWRLAQQLKARREIVRGKPETFNRPDYNFRLEREDSSAPPHWARDGAHWRAPTRRAAGPDRGRGHDFGQQHLGPVAGQFGRAWHLPQPGQFGPWRESAHGHQSAATRWHWRAGLCVEHIAASPLHRLGQPVANHCLRAPRRHSRFGRPVQAQRCAAVCHHQRV